jgi:hypothetical protein
MFARGYGGIGIHTRLRGVTARCEGSSPSIPTPWAVERDESGKGLGNGSFQLEERIENRGFSKSGASEMSPLGHTGNFQFSIHNFQ